MLRIIPRLDIKGESLVKTIYLEGLRKIGLPNEYAIKYYKDSADELLFMDLVATLYGRNNLHDIIFEASKNIFIPLTVGGGIRTVDDAIKCLKSGADKVAVNTAAVLNPQLITDIAQRFGSQCMVLSIEAKQVGLDSWEVYTDNGRERTNLDVIEWVKHGVEMGAGEVLLTSVDREGTRKGFDIPLVKAVSEAVDVPVIASGGMGKAEDFVTVVNEGCANAVAMADILHYKRAVIGDIRAAAEKVGLDVRHYEIA